MNDTSIPEHAGRRRNRSPERRHFPPPPESVGFLLTYKCTAACDDCCFECTPKRSETLPLGHALRAIDELGEISSLRGITFSGGECFLRYHDMIAIAKRAREKGLRVKCVTNAYWATNAKVATKKLQPLMDAGLGTLEVSTDDYHVPYVPFDRAAHALEAAHALGLETHVIVVYDSHTRRLGDVLRELKLTFDPDVAREFAALPVGFAKDRIPPERLVADNTPRLRPCADIGRRPSITPRGEVYSCCSVAGCTPPLRLGAVGEDSLADLFEHSNFDALSTVLSLDGPAALAKIAAAEIGFDADRPFVDECHLCHALLSDDAIVRRLKKVLEKNKICYLLRRDYAEFILNSDGDDPRAPMAGTSEAGAAPPGP